MSFQNLKPLPPIPSLVPTCYLPRIKLPIGLTLFLQGLKLLGHLFMEHSLVLLEHVQCIQVHLSNVFEDSTNSKLFGCTCDGVHQGVLLSINHGVLLRVQQVPLLVFLNLCFSIIKIVTLAHILSWFECQCSLDVFLFGLQGNLSFLGSNLLLFPTW